MSLTNRIPVVGVHTATNQNYDYAELLIKLKVKQIENGKITFQTAYNQLRLNGTVRNHYEPDEINKILYFELGLEDNTRRVISWYK